MDALPHVILCVEKLAVCLLQRCIGGNKIGEAALQGSSINKGLCVDNRLD